MSQPDLVLAQTLFTQLRELSFDGTGITRDTYGTGEQAAHTLFTETANQYGLEVSTDAAMNLYITLPGQDRKAPVVMTGSHADSVPRGGNYDGAAGVVAGLSILAGWCQSGVKPMSDVTVMAIRAEESAWFPVSYIGSKAAFGLLTAHDLKQKRFDTQKTLAEHIRDAGGNPSDIEQGVASLGAKNIKCFLELHIEQGPVLIENNDVLGVVTGICGSLRYRHAHITGEYAHSGATPRSHRHDAVIAAADLVMHLDHIWATLEKEGHELTLTFGQMNTDIKQADLSKVSGYVEFCIDVRSRHTKTLEIMDSYIKTEANNIENKYGVTINLGPLTGSQPAIMNDGLQQALANAAQKLACRMRYLPSGAGHDTALFSNQGIPTAMLFIRNAHGSHNPQEAMDISDFNQGVCVLADVLAQQAGIVLTEKEDEHA